MPESHQVVAGNELFPEDSPIIPPLLQSVRKAQQAEVTTLKNQLLKSHGRPPCTSSSFSLRTAAKILCPLVSDISSCAISVLQGTARTDSQSGRRLSSASLVSPFPATLGGKGNVDLVCSRNGIEKSHRRFREWKGRTTSMSVNTHTQSFISPDPRRTSNRPEARLYPHGYHPISSPFPPPSQNPPSLAAHVVFLDRIAFTRDIPQKNLSWLSRASMISTTLIQSTCRCSPK